jgi:hypothetical protein
MRVHLFTRDGGFVHEVSIPPFHPPPEIISWGSRLFMCDDGRTERDEAVPVRYVEGKPYVVLDHAHRATE